MARRLAQEEGIFCGISSGCNVAAALKLAAEDPKYRRVATVINDNGLRYLSTELCGGPAKVDSPDRHHPVDPELGRRLKHLKLHIIS